MANPLLIACGAVVAVFLLLICASMFGVSRRAVEAEMRRVEEEEADGAHARRERDDMAA
ncbi:MAG TPA: hypothetical protein VGL44_13420 [Gaiellales bacterium]|jgi:hypothetical protein